MFYFLGVCEYNSIKNMPAYCCARLKIIQHTSIGPELTACSELPLKGALSVNKTCIALALALLINSAPVDAARVSVDRILATVNGEIITQSEFEKYKAMLLMGAQEIPADMEADRQLLGQLIEKKLILQEAKKLEITMKDKDIENALDEVLRRNKIDLKTLSKELAKKGTTVADYKKILEGELIQSRTIGRAVHSKINISDKDMQEFYDQNMRGSNKAGPRVRIQQILLLIPGQASPAQIADIEKTANDLHRKILAGEDFGKLAVKYSQGAGAQLGGDIGYFHKDELLPEIEKLAFSLQKDQVSPVFKTEIGFHIIKVIDTAGSGNTPGGSWEDHKRDIQNAIYGAQFEKEMTLWMQQLKQKAYIEIN
jgi:parvulin-like peptidyl-prolyl isomerase